MNSSLKSLTNPPIVEYFSDDVEYISEVVNKRDNDTQIKSKKKVLSVDDSRVTLSSKGRGKYKKICSLCLKHTLLVPVDISVLVPTSDLIRCLKLIDPTGNEMLIRFKNQQRALIWFSHIKKYNDHFNAEYASFHTTICVINEASDLIEGQIRVEVCGNIRGSDMKTMVEEKFNIPGLLSQKYSLEIQSHLKIISIPDNVYIFNLNEYFCHYTAPMFCSTHCKNSPSEAPTNEITLLILDQLNKERKNFEHNPHKPSIRNKKEGILLMYNIEERWRVNALPTWLMRLLSDLYYHGPDFQGIFRISANAKDLATYYERILTREDFQVDESIQTKACVLKLFLRKIENGLMNLSTQSEVNTLLEGFESLAQYMNNSKSKKKLLNLIQSLTPRRFLLLQYLLVVFQSITESPKAQMNGSNLARVFEPTIFHNLPTEFGQKNCKKLVVVIECIIDSTDKIVDAETRQDIVETLSKYNKDKTMETEIQIQKPAEEKTVLREINKNQINLRKIKSLALNKERPYVVRVQRRSTRGVISLKRSGPIVARDSKSLKMFQDIVVDSSKENDEVTNVNDQSVMDYDIADEESLTNRPILRSKKRGTRNLSQVVLTPVADVETCDNNADRTTASVSEPNHPVEDVKESHHREGYMSKLSVDNCQESETCSGSGSPYVKNMVEMFEERIRKADN